MEVLTENHKPDNAIEKARITERGGKAAPPQAKFPGKVIETQAKAGVSDRGLRRRAPHGHRGHRGPRGVPGLRGHPGPGPRCAAMHE